MIPFALIPLLLQAGIRLSTVDIYPYGEIAEFCVQDGIMYASMEPDWMDDGSAASLMALDLASGAPVWIRSASTGSSISTPWDLQLSGGCLYAITGNSGLICKAAGTGETEFLWESPDHFIAPLIVQGDTLSAGWKNGVAAMLSRTGELIWRFDEELGEIGMYPTIIDIQKRGNRLYAGSILPSVRCFDAVNGELMWTSNEVMDSRGGGYAAIDFASDSCVFVSTASDEITVLNASDGTRSNCFENCRYLAGDEEGIYLHSFLGNSILCLDPVTGSVTDSIAMPLEDWSIHCAMGNGHMILAQDDGSVMLLRRWPLEMVLEDELGGNRTWTFGWQGWLAAMSGNGRMMFCTLPDEAVHMENLDREVSGPAAQDQLGRICCISDGELLSVQLSRNP